MTKRKSGASAPPTIIHEFNNALQHRIVLVKNGTTEAGDWVSVTTVAFHANGLYANATLQNGLPDGVFRISKQPSQQLLS